VKKQLWICRLVKHGKEFGELEGEWWEELAKFPFTIEELEFFNKIDYDPEMLDIDCCKLKWKYDKECEESFLVHAKNCPYIKAQKKLQKLIDSLKTGD